MSGSVGARPDAVVDWGNQGRSVRDDFKDAVHGAVDHSSQAMGPVVRNGANRSIGGTCGPTGTSSLAPAVNAGTERSTRAAAQVTKDTLDSSIDRCATSETSQSGGWGAWISSWFSSGN